MKEKSATKNALSFFANTIEQKNEKKSVNKTTITSSAKVIKKLQSSSLSEEQEAVVFCKDQNIKVNAYAGCGKTHTLLNFAKEQISPKERGLYLAFNRSLKEEAQKKFPKNILCLTTHGLAYKNFGVKLVHKINPIQMKHLEKFCEKKDDVGFYDFFVRAVYLTFKNFCYSKDLTIQKKHIEFTELDDAGFKDEFLSLYSEEELISSTEKLFLASIDENDDTPIDHDVYLKLMHLTQPRLAYDFILLDEAQDSNPVVYDIVNKQTHSRKILVGDSYQAIYQFRNTMDGLNEFDGTKFSLTSSYRFDKNIAQVLNTFLLLYGETKPVRGLSSVSSNIYHYNSASSEQELKSTIHELILIYNGSVAVLGRTNMELLETALNCIDLGVKFHFLGGESQLQFELLFELYDILRNNTEPKNAFLKAFAAQFPHKLNGLAFIEKLKEHCELLNNEWFFRCKFVLRYKNNLAMVINHLRSLMVTNANQPNVVTLSTVHKAKGLEYDYVFLLDSFSSIGLYEQKEKLLAKALQKSFKKQKEKSWETVNSFLTSPEMLIDLYPKHLVENLNLIYVAISRAKKAIYLPTGISKHVNFIGGRLYGKKILDLPSSVFKKHFNFAKDCPFTTLQPFGLSYSLMNALKEFKDALDQDKVKGVF